MTQEQLSFSWLRAQGFKRHMQPTGSHALSLGRGKCSLTIELADVDNNRWRIGISDGDVSVWLPAGLTPQTKTELADLCKAFGFTLKEPTNEQR